MEVPPTPVSRPKPLTPGQREALARHWRRSLRWTALLLVVWAAASLGAGVVFADELNQWRLGGFPLGFWFAQQGAILVFLALVLAHALTMTWLDRRHRRESRPPESP